MGRLKFKKRWIADEAFEAAAFIDVDNDGVLDIVSGEFWYKGPDFRKKNYIGKSMRDGEYYDEFSVVPLDVNKDGYTDYITGGWWGDTMYWMENPGEKGGEWTRHILAEKVGNIETTKGFDIDGDGELEIIPNNPGEPVIIYKLTAPGEFTSYKISDFAQGHGMGFGDMNGNGRTDIIICSGWFEAPESIDGDWKFHEFQFSDVAASVPMIVADINGDGLNEIIVGSAHGFGLWYWQKEGDTFKRCEIDPWSSQYHDILYIDIDNDGEKELVTGKRFRAHCGNDNGEWDDIGVYYFKWNGNSFTKNVIDYIRIEEGTGGVGIYFDAADTTGNGFLDVLAPGKGGLYLYENLGMEEY